MFILHNFELWTGNELTLFGYVTGSNQQLYPPCHVSLRTAMYEFLGIINLLSSATVYSGKQSKWLSSTFQPPEEGRSVQRLKRWDKHYDKDDDNSQKRLPSQGYMVSVWTVMDSVKGRSDMSSNLRQDCLHFSWRLDTWERYISDYSPFSNW